MLSGNVTPISITGSCMCSSICKQLCQHCLINLRPNQTQRFIHVQNPGFPYNHCNKWYYSWFERIIWLLRNYSDSYWLYSSVSFVFIEPIICRQNYKPILKNNHDFTWPNQTQNYIKEDQQYICLMFTEADNRTRAKQLYSGDGTRQWDWSFGVVAISWI